MNIIKHFDDNGILHSEGTPTVIYPEGSKEYFWHGMRHRTDGPAIELSNGIKQYYILDKKITNIELQRLNSLFVPVKNNMYNLFYCLNMTDFEYESNEHKFGYVSLENFELVDGKLNLKEFENFFV